MFCFVFVFLRAILHTIFECLVFIFYQGRSFFFFFSNRYKDWRASISYPPDITLFIFFLIIQESGLFIENIVDGVHFRSGGHYYLMDCEEYFYLCPSGLGGGAVTPTQRGGVSVTP